ncbi:hypothetical protein HIM_04177 [Hirsutella minnesotensis 3608]|uniref:Uncharacterized protein n=1 Tax=Hirsutella minnesotensis 3608 TaxID=1043627 RepID=A0A0F7ZVE0_9HYPO|nr:hypothetical protein HIM_04177 [Hirsutella minnesotensis 3608]
MKLSRAVVTCLATTVQASTDRNLVGQAQSFANGVASVAQNLATEAVANAASLASEVTSAGGGIASAAVSLASVQADEISSAIASVTSAAGSVASSLSAAIATETNPTAVSSLRNELASVTASASSATKSLATEVTDSHKNAAQGFNPKVAAVMSALSGGVFLFAYI